MDRKTCNRCNRARGFANGGLFSRKALTRFAGYTGYTVTHIYKDMNKRVFKKRLKNSINGHSRYIKKRF